MYFNGTNYLGSNMTKVNLTVFYELLESDIQTAIFIIPKIIQSYIDEL